MIHIIERYHVDRSGFADEVRKEIRIWRSERMFEIILIRLVHTFQAVVFCMGQSKKYPKLQEKRSCPTIR